MNPSNQRVVRMLAMVPYLQTRMGIPVDDLATEFGVRRRQIIDDLHVLMLTGAGEFHGELIDFDLTALENDGVVRIRDAEFMTRPLRLSVREAAALIVALRTLRQAAAPEQRGAIDGALAKLEGAVGGTVDPPVDVALPEVDHEVRDAVATALSRGLQLRIDYASASRDTMTHRTIEPRRVFTEAGAMYVSAWCHQSGALRTFRLDRISAVHLTDTRAEHRDDPAAPSVAAFAPGADTPHAILDLAPSARWMADYYAADIIDDRGEVLRVRLYGSDMAWLCRLVLGGSGDVTVVEPPELARQVATTITAALAQYAGDDSHGGMTDA